MLKILKINLFASFVSFTEYVPLSSQYCRFYLQKSIFFLKYSEKYEAKYYIK